MTTLPSKPSDRLRPPPGDRRTARLGPLQLRRSLGRRPHYRAGLRLLPLGGALLPRPSLSSIRLGRLEPPPRSLLPTPWSHRRIPRLDVARPAPAPRSLRGSRRLWRTWRELQRREGRRARTGQARNEPECVALEEPVRVQCRPPPSHPPPLTTSPAKLLSCTEAELPRNSSARSILDRVIPARVVPSYPNARFPTSTRELGFRQRETEASHRSASAPDPYPDVVPRHSQDSLSPFLQDA